MDTSIPQHIAIIMDGNGRWAQKRGLPREAGHRQGSKAVREITSYCSKIGVKTLTLYAFSTENWSRPKEEISSIMKLLSNYLDEAEKHKKENIKVVVLGDTAPLDDKMKEKIRRIEKESCNFTGMTLNIAFNYGGRQEIIAATKRISTLVANEDIVSKDITEELFASFLYTKGNADPDIIIRPSGEKRISNFLLWQCAYSEFVFMDVLWPDMTPKHLDEAIEEYNSRNRRFGGI